MGKVNIWWPMYPADFSIDTAHLTLEEVGAYVKLLNAAWRQGGSIPCDSRHLSNIVGVSSQKWRNLSKSIAPLFTATDGKWRSDMLSEEFAKAKANSEAKRRNANKRWDARQDQGMQMHSNSNANASDESMQMQCPSPSPSQGLPVSSLPGGDIAFTDEEIAAAGKAGSS